MVIPREAIIDAWWDLQSFVKVAFANSDPEWHRPIMLTDQKIDINRGTLLGIPIDDPATFSLFDQGIYVFQGIELLPATFPEADKALLPIHFSALQVQGHYRLYQAGWEQPRVNVKGIVRETVSNSTLFFHANIGPQLTLTGLSITDPVKMEVDPDLQIPSSFWWTPEESDRYMGVQKARAWMPKTMPGEYLAASLKEPVIAVLKQKLGV